MNTPRRRDPLAELDAYIAGEPTDPHWCVNCQQHRTREPDELCPVCTGIAKTAKDTERRNMGWAT